MKITAFFAVILFTFYIAGMFRSLPLMVLCITELILMIVMRILPRYFRAHLSADFQKRSETTYDGVDTLCRISIQNKGKLPINRVGLSIRIRNAQVAGSSVKKLYCIGERGVKKLYCIGERGENTLEFKICSEYCGLVLIQAERLYAYDYLTLFSSAEPLSSEMKIAVFPKEQPLDITVSDLGRTEGCPSNELTISLRGDAYSDIRRIREYLPGDLTRHIHRNLSAKTDRLWIKEYESETNYHTDVLADPGGLSNATAAQLSAFYKLLSALVLGLLKQYTSVGVYWNCGKNKFTGMDIANAEQCRDMLLLLYQMKQNDFSDEIPCQCCFRLTSELALFAENSLVCRFSAENLDNEIREKKIII